MYTLVYVGVRSDLHSRDVLVVDTQFRVSLVSLTVYTAEYRVLIRFPLSASEYRFFRVLDACVRNESYDHALKAHGEDLTLDFRPCRSDRLLHGAVDRLLSQHRHSPGLPETLPIALRFAVHGPHSTDWIGYLLYPILPTIG